LEKEAAELRSKLAQAEGDVEEKERERGEMLEVLARMEEEARDLKQRCQQLDQQRAEESHQHRLNLQSLQDRLESDGESLEASLQSRLGEIC
jgi:chromosome segregation ATPase